MARRISSDVAYVVNNGGQLLTQIDIYDKTKENVVLTSRREDGASPSMSIVSGSVHTDETRSVWGTVDLTCIVDDATAAAVVPVSGHSPLSPSSGALAQLSFTTPGSTHEPTAYGLYEIEHITLREEGSGVTLDVHLNDLARKVERAAFFRPRVIQAKSSYEDGFRLLLQTVLTDSEINVAPQRHFTAVHSFDVQDDRLQAVRSLARAVGCRVDFNDGGIGNVMIESDADSDDDPAWIFTDEGGEKNAIITSVPQRMLTRETMYNGVVAMGESSGSDKPPVRAEAWDTDPTSPTYFDPSFPDESSFGPIPFFYVSQFITTKQQAQRAADARLPKVLGVSERLIITAIPNPGIETGDPILVSRPRIRAEGMFIVESTSMPLTASGPMTITCRERKIFNVTVS